ncbi:MAG: hypothetical protein ACKOTB_01505, partial [Planctomycetia bacterium]
SPTVILLAALGCLATWAGWSVADRLAIPSPASPRMIADDEPAVGAGGAVASAPAALPRASRRPLPWLAALVQRLPGTARDVVRLLFVPFRPTVTLGDHARTRGRGDPEPVGHRPAGPGRQTPERRQEDHGG